MGAPCFGGGWFIMVASFPSAHVTNHYNDEFWDLCDVPDVLLALGLGGRNAGHRRGAASRRTRQLASTMCADWVWRCLRATGGCPPNFFARICWGATSVVTPVARPRRPSGASPADPSCPGIRRRSSP
ncbi:WDGH domain-containing protein [Pengzhenrongella sicca]